MGGWPGPLLVEFGENLLASATSSSVLRVHVVVGTLAGKAGDQYHPTGWSSLSTSPWQY